MAAGVLCGLDGVEVPMPSLLEWLVKERCLWHAEPMFDRDLSGVRAAWRPGQFFRISAIATR